MNAAVFFKSPFYKEIFLMMNTGSAAGVPDVLLLPDLGNYREI